MGVNMSESGKYKREIRSFVLRAGRMTPAQQRGMEQGFARYGVSSSQGLLDPVARFGRDENRILEIGFGMGHAFLEQVESNPDADFIGVEVHTPGVGSVLNKALDSDLPNLVVYNEDVNAVLNQSLPDNSLAKVQLFFPDPWPKKRHHKRRLVSLPFVELIAQKLKPGGVFHMATDWAPYAEYMEEVMATCPIFSKQDLAIDAIFLPRFSTRFERRGVALGHEVADLVYVKR
jgi:tRNA (guanine-N7-)-methyltransferase